MDPEVVEQNVLGLLRPIARRSGAIVESVALRVRGGETSLEITVDRQDGTDPLPLDEVANLSRAFSDALDAADPVEGTYSLEVSTRGAESDLNELRHYHRNLGRQLRVRLKDGEKLEGLLAGVSSQTFRLDTPQGQREIPFEEVRRARPRVTFS